MLCICGKERRKRKGRKVSGLAVAVAVAVAVVFWVRSISQWPKSLFVVVQQDAVADESSLGSHGPFSDATSSGSSITTTQEVVVPPKEEPSDEKLIASPDMKNAASNELTVAPVEKHVEENDKSSPSDDEHTDHEGSESSLSFDNDALLENNMNRCIRNQAKRHPPIRTMFLWKPSRQVKPRSTLKSTRSLLSKMRRQPPSWSLVKHQKLGRP